MIKLSSPCLGNLEQQAVCRVLESHVINMGIETKHFEEELKDFFNVPGINVLCVNSGTAAIHLSLQAQGIGFGDEVLVPTYTFIATFQAVSATGAVPVPVDVDPEDAFINLKDAEARLTSRTKAILPVFFAGCGAGKAAAVYNFAKTHKLCVVEDAAHCFGEEGIANRNGPLCFSFDAIKNITCSDGGCVVTKNNEIAERIKDARLLGVIGDTEARYSGQRSWNADTKEQGWRYHMSNVCAAIGRAQLSRFDELRKKRQTYSRMYIEGLQNNPNIRLFPVNADTAVPHIFPIVVKNGQRDSLKKYLAGQGIESGVQYKPNHFLTKFNRGYPLPGAEKLYESILSIPLHPRLSSDDVSFVIEKIHEFYGVSKDV